MAGFRLFCWILIRVSLVVQLTIPCACTGRGELIKTACVPEAELGIAYSDSDMFG